MRRYAVYALAAFVALVGGYLGFGYLSHGQFIESTDDAYVKADTASIAPRVNGYIEKVHVADNQTVHAGDILVSIEDADFRAALDQARAVAASKQSVVESLESKLELENKLIDAAVARVTSAVAEQKLASANLARATELRDQGAGSRQNYDSALAASRQADAAVATAQAALEAERSQLAVVESNRAQNKADYDAAVAAQKMAEINLEHTLIRAPFDGVVGARTAQDGQFVRAGGQLMAIVRLSEVYVVANFKETQAGEMRRGQKVEVTFDAFPDETLSGHIDSFAPATGSEFSLLPPENATGNFTKVVQRLPVKVMLDAGAETLNLLRPGMSAIVAVDTRDEGEGATARLAPAPRPVEAVDATKR